MAKRRKYTVWHGKNLNTRRVFGKETRSTYGDEPQFYWRKYSGFSGVDKNGKDFNYNMNTKQVDEFEKSIMKKLVKQVLVAASLDWRP